MSDEHIIIRTMKMEDLPQVMAIEKEVYTDPWQDEMFYQEIDLGSSFVLEDVSVKVILGYMCGIMILDEFSLMNIAITSKYQSKGYGSLLLDYLFLSCLKNRCNKVFLEVRASNLNAQNLYEKKGFRHIGKRKNYYQNPAEDALLMMLEVKGVKDEDL